jgi:hypothetical protein
MVKQELNVGLRFREGLVALHKTLLQILNGLDCILEVPLHDIRTTVESSNRVGRTEWTQLRQPPTPSDKTDDEITT